MENNKIKLHRVLSASATFQKGLYHLLALKNIKPFDSFDVVLRKYQCIFLLGITQRLLDLKTEIKPNPRYPKDPAAWIQHSTVEKWSGFELGHSMREISQRTKDIFDRIVDARHNLIYRPEYLESESGWYWKDCTLNDLLRKVPSIKEIEDLYKAFFSAMEIWETKVTSDDQLWIPHFKIFTFQKFSNSQKMLFEAYADLLRTDQLNAEEQMREFLIQTLGEKIKGYL